MSSGAVVTSGSWWGSSGSSGSMEGACVAPGSCSGCSPERSGPPSNAMSAGDWRRISRCQPSRSSSSGRFPSSARRAAETKAGLSASVWNVWAAAPMSAVSDSTHTVTVVKKRAVPRRSIFDHRPCPLLIGIPVLSSVL